MAKLILRSADGAETELPLDELGSASIGRAPECDMPITDGQASRRHCSVVKLSSGWEMSDLGSTNGTLVNSTLTKKKRLSHGDVIRIGETEIVFHDMGFDYVSLTGAALEPADRYAILVLSETDGALIRDVAAPLQ